MLQIKGFGWKPDLPDFRDFGYAAPAALIKKLPSKVDLRNRCPKVYKQGDLGSCTANAIAAAIEFELIKQNSPDFMPSRLFIYYNERVIENTIDIDNGAYIRDGIKSVNKQGVCPEPMWPYIISEFTKKPFFECYQNAKKHLVTSYKRISRNLSQLKGCLAEGYPFIFGFAVYESFKSDKVKKTGIVNIPDVNKESLQGGHAVLAVGYDDSSKRFIVRNSWGEKWGQKGYFTMPYDYLLHENLSDDFWTINLMMSNPAIHKNLEQ
ncbi:MAG: C1 family peptidase [Ignavibacteria bacterium]|nr:C1 family peptidase [Ignavibacteria bacterium]